MTAQSGVSEAASAMPPPAAGHTDAMARVLEQELERVAAVRVVFHE